MPRENLRITILVAVFLAALQGMGCAVRKRSSGNASRIWDWRLSSIISQPPPGVTISGSPRMIHTRTQGAVVQFNGVDDAIFYDRDPVAGWSRFTIEMIFRPAPHGPFAQRIINLGSSRGPRITIEIRNTGTAWYLDAFMASNGNLTLTDSTRLHPDGQWYNVAFTVDRGRMRTFVNGKAELSGKVAFAPLPQGKSSFGVRLNRRYWFKGAMREIRISPFLVGAAHFLPVTEKANQQ